MACCIESILITACRNGSLYRVYNNNCMPEWLTIIIESILITVCQNGSLYRVYNNNCIPHGSAHARLAHYKNLHVEWLTLMMITVCQMYARMAS